jgi:hypothetical protein
MIPDEAVRSLAITAHSEFSNIMRLIYHGADRINREPIQSLLKIFSVLNGHPRLRFFRERWAQIEILSTQNGWAHGVYVFGYK